MRVPSRPIIPKNRKSRRQGDDKLKMPITELLPIRTANMLEAAGIDKVETLLNCTRADLRAVPGVGPATLKQILEALAELGFKPT